MTPRERYEADVKRRPHYHDGTPRRSWEELCDIAQRSWAADTLPRLFIRPADNGDQRKSA